MKKTAGSHLWTGRFDTYFNIILVIATFDGARKIKGKRR
jgi:hypothetical protein